MYKERRFERVPCNEKVIVNYNEIFLEARLSNISVNGALVLLNEEFPMQLGDKCRITISLNVFDVTLHFLAEIRHSQRNEAGVQFLFLDSDTKIYLNNLLAFRKENPQLISEEFNYSRYSKDPPEDDQV